MSVTRDEVVAGLDALEPDAGLSLALQLVDRIDDCMAVMVAQLPAGIPPQRTLSRRWQ